MELEEIHLSKSESLKQNDNNKKMLSRVLVVDGIQGPKSEPVHRQTTSSVRTHFLVIFKTVIGRFSAVHKTYVMPCLDFSIVSLPESQLHEVGLLMIPSYKGKKKRFRE